jgi:hypothetical protein
MRHINTHTHNPLIPPRPPHTQPSFPFLPRSEVRRVLRPGGVLVFDTINRTFKSYILTIVLAQVRSRFPAMKETKGAAPYPLLNNPPAV